MKMRVPTILVCGVVCAACASDPVSGSAPRGSLAAAGSGSASPAYAAGSGSVFGSVPAPNLGSSGALAPPVSWAGAAGTAGGVTSCASLTQTAAIEPGKADIVWAIDGSGSMLDELAAVQQNITSFANSIGQAGIDHHVVMVAEDDVAGATPLGGDAGHYLHVPADVGSHNALQILLSEYPAYSKFLRADATLHFVVVTDDESRLSAAEFQPQMEQLSGKKFVFHAIASEDVNGDACAGTCGFPIVCGAANPGLEYYALADATGGQKVSICITDWSMVFGALQQAVIASTPLPCAYELPKSTTGETLDPAKVNLDFSPPTGVKATFPRAQDSGACGSERAWYYDDPAAPKKIQMCPSACEAIKAGGTIDIQLGCETVVLL